MVMVVGMIALLLCAPDSALTGYGWAKIVGGIVFAIAAFTDFLDGHIARSKGMVTTFGKFLDPIADKLLINSTFIIFAGQVFPDVSILPIIAIIMVGRDIMVDAIRMIMVDKKVVIAASKLGKLKTVTQIFAILALFFLPTSINWCNGTWYSISAWMTYLAAAISLISGADYFWKNRKPLLTDM
jgi:CDP-diacylglycerol--glycerol-3-phosphate 3-phosphatidyltransferase